MLSKYYSFNMGSLIIPNLGTPACCKLRDTSAAGVLEYVNLQYPKLGRPLVALLAERGYIVNYSIRGLGG